MKIGKNSRIYPHAYIGDHVTIGDNCTVYPHATIYNGLRNRQQLHSACRERDRVGWFRFSLQKAITTRRFPQLGNVVLEDDVEIGANTTIDRAVMDSTIIRRGVKLDNLVQIAHNVEVGENTVMAAQVGIAGSVKIGSHCMFGGQAGLSGHIHVADHVVFGAQCGVISDVKEPATLLGAPAINAKAFMRSSAIFNRLPDMYRQMGQMQREIERLKLAIDNARNGQ